MSATNINLNGSTFLVVGAAIVVYIVYRKISNTDLNPFDKDGFIGKFFYDEQYEEAKKALAKKGINIAYYEMFKGDLKALPKGSWKVLFKGKVYYYSPKQLSVTNPQGYNDEAGAGSYG